MPEVVCLSGSWLDPSGNVAPGFVLIEGEKISQAGTGTPPIHPSYRLPPDSVILPGFIDLQINGAFGTDLQQDIEGIALLSQQLPRHGVVAFLPTIVSSRLERYEEILSACDLTPAPFGAVPLGLHIEGPCINPARKGAHDLALLRPPLHKIVTRFLRPGLVRMVTLAPELPHGIAAISLLREAGIVAAVGHSEATYEEAQGAFEAGAGHGTHLFNAMSPLHHRRPGLAGALLERSAPPAGIIVDGIHVHPAMLRLARGARGVDGLTLVSDAMASAGTCGGTLSIGGQNVTVDKGGAHLEDGTLAGSTILLDDAVRNAVRYGMCTLAEAAFMASRTPARVLGIDDRKGMIAAGYDADLVVLDDKMTVSSTIIGGQIAYERV